MKLIGKAVGKLHKADIAHGDLTTSNMIYASHHPSSKKEKKEESKVFIIDFGLGFQNAKYEDKGVDIHLLKQALEAKHFKNWEILFSECQRILMAPKRLLD